MQLIDRLRRVAPSRADAARRWERRLPLVPQGDRITKIVHQTYPTRELPAVLEQGLQQERDRNPAWDFRLYSDADIELFIGRDYGDEVLALYRRIRPDYGAARADLFRYLVVYKLGGAYLDIKSRFTRPIDSVIEGSEGFIVAQWRNAPGEEHEGMGILPDLQDVPGGEYQQWHVIAAPGHPFLRAVLIDVLSGIECYSPWRTSVGRIGVVRLTGPIAYTRAIHPILARHPHRFYRTDSEVALQYSGYPRSALFRSTHYSELTQPIVRRGIASALSDRLFRVALAAKRRLRGAGDQR